jgi:hypothetical protein
MGTSIVAYHRVLCHYRWRCCVDRSGATSCKICPLNTKRYRDSAYNGSFLESCLCKEDFWRHDMLPGAVGPDTRMLRRLVPLSCDWHCYRD